MAFETDFLEGFDAYGLDETVMGKLWLDQGDVDITLNNVTRRGASGSSLRVNADSFSRLVTRTLSKAYRSVIMGFAVYYPVNAVSYDTGDKSPISLISGPNAMITLQLQTSGVFVLRRGTQSGTVLATGTTTLAPQTWYYLELKVFIDDTAGAYEFKINGATEFSGSSVDTNVSATVDTITKVNIYNASTTSAGYDFYIDDIYCRGDVTTNTAGGFLGDVRVVTIRPDADGTYEQWTLSTGVDAYALIDELLPDTADYLESATAAEKFTVSHESLTASGTIVAVEQYVHTSTPDGTTRDVYPLCRSNSLDYPQSAIRAKSGAYVSHVYEVDPNTSSAWAESALNAAEFGLEIA